MHCSRPSQYVLPLGISLAMGLKEEGRSVWLMRTLGPFGPGGKRSIKGTYPLCRSDSTDQTATQCRPSRMIQVCVVTLAAGVRKVRLLLGLAVVECRPSWAPPISTDTLSAAVELLAISCRAHCLLRGIGGLWERRADCWVCFVSVQRKSVSL
jgi:hypothetical protein